MLYAMADNNIDIPASRDGALYNALANGQDFVISGIGDEFEVTYSGSSLTVTLGTGIGVVCGRHVQEDIVNGATSSFEVEAGSSGYIVVRFDLTRPTGQEAYFTATPTLVAQDLNNGGDVHDLPLYQYTAGAAGVNTMVDVRNIMSSLAGSGFAVYQTTLASANWSSNQQTVTVPSSVLSGIDYSSDLYVEISLPESASSAVRNAVARAVISTSTTLTGSTLSVLFSCENTPSVDIPVIIVAEGRTNGN